MTASPGVTFLLTGDVMLGRGVDQIQRHHVSPELHEPYVASAEEYVALAERVNGPLPRRVRPAYVWGDALAALSELRPAARIINLETSITADGHAAPKEVTYRMHPGNVDILAAAGIDCCVLANNHVGDYGDTGLLETLDVLAAAGISAAGAGPNLDVAERPAILPLDAGARIVLFAFGCPDSGIPESWRATARRPGVNLLPDFSDRSTDAVAARIRQVAQPRDIVVVSLHWGSNWGFGIPPSHRRFAHALIDRGRVDVVHGHSSHHPRAIELYHGRPILYGCGDLLNDYEGIGEHDGFRSDLSLLYLPRIDPASGALEALAMLPMRIHRFRLEHASAADRQLLHAMLDAECRRFGAGVGMRDGVLSLDRG